MNATNIESEGECLECASYENILKKREATIKQLQEENQRLRNDLLDAINVKSGNGPTALSMVISENQRLKEALKTCISELMYESQTGHWWMWARNSEAVSEKLTEIRKIIYP